MISTWGPTVADRYDRPPTIGIQEVAGVRILPLSFTLGEVEIRAKNYGRQTEVVFNVFVRDDLGRTERRTMTTSFDPWTLKRVPMENVIRDLLNNAFRQLVVECVGKK